MVDKHCKWGHASFPCLTKQSLYGQFKRSEALKVAWDAYFTFIIRYIYYQKNNKTCDLCPIFFLQYVLLWGLTYNLPCSKCNRPQKDIFATMAWKFSNMHRQCYKGHSPAAQEEPPSHRWCFALQAALAADIGTRPPGGACWGCGERWDKQVGSINNICILKIQLTLSSQGGKLSNGCPVRMNW